MTATTRREACFHTSLHSQAGVVLQSGGVMGALAQSLIEDQADARAEPPLVVVGTGPVGVRVVRELLRRRPIQPIVLYGDEPWNPYNRVQLSNLLAGRAMLEELDNSLATTRVARLEQRLNCPVTAIHRERRCVIDAAGREQPYAALLLAVGSRPHIPNMDGARLRGVFTFRNLSDAQALLARTVRSRHTVVLGGGLLGLEAARAMQRRHTAVTVIQRGPRLLDRNLDDAAAALLQQRMASLGMQVRLNSSVRRVLGETRVEGVELLSGERLACDTLVVATGIVPNVELAREAGIAVGRGIKVDDAMRTSDPRVFAVGECAEHRGQIYGIVAPGLEQAGVAAHVALGGEARYEGSLAAASLKVIDQQVFSVGRIGDDVDRLSERERCYRDDASGVYRKLVTRRGRLVGAIALGSNPELNRLREAVAAQRRLSLLQRWRFGRSGRLWRDEASQQVAAWPAAALVCNCMGVSRGRLGECMDGGACSVDELKRRTGASSVCGSCLPLLEALVGEAESGRTAAKTRRGLLLLSLLGLLLALALASLPPWPLRDSVQSGFTPDLLWTDGLVKQVSGFSLLGLGLLGLVISLRKRVRWFRLGGFNGWRTLHVVLGLLMLLTLGLHTGLALGINLNRLLMLDMLLLMVLGAGAGGVAALEPRIGGQSGPALRRGWNLLHLLAAWPLPVLLGFHVLSVYYF